MGQTRNASVASSKMPARRRSQAEWEARRLKIEQLYVVKKKRLSYVMEALASEGFIRSENQYKKQLHRWRIWKSGRAKQNYIDRTTQWEQAPKTQLTFPHPDSSVSTSSNIDFNTLLAHDTSTPSVFDPSTPPILDVVSSLSNNTVPWFMENVALIASSRRQPLPWKDRQCLRCSLLGLETRYSDDDAYICVACQKLSYAYEKQMLGFFACIRTVLRDVNIFKAYLPPDGQHSHVLAEMKNLALSKITLDFASQINNWCLDDHVNDVVHWLNSSSHSNTSKVGILSSDEFLRLATSVVHKSICTSFQWMIYAISLAYTQLAAG